MGGIKVERSVFDAIMLYHGQAFVITGFVKIPSFGVGGHCVRNRLLESHRAHQSRLCYSFGFYIKYMMTHFSSQSGTEVTGFDHILIFLNGLLSLNKNSLSISQRHQVLARL